MERFFGGNPIAVMIRLIIMSVVVGIVLAAFGLSPLELLEAIQRLTIRIYDMGFDAIEWALQYFLLGAVIVIPVWFLSRLFSTSRKNSDS
ncbi:MAG: DUF6460 domain-containing protein [Pseudomonadota bacterium]